MNSAIVPNDGREWKITYFEYAECPPAEAIYLHTTVRDTHASAIRHWFLIPIAKKMGDAGDYWRDVKEWKQEQLAKRSPKQVRRDAREREAAIKVFAQWDEEEMAGKVQRLREKGYEVKQFSAYHIRVNGELDVWHGRSGTSYRDRDGKIKSADSVIQAVINFFNKTAHD